MNTSQNHPSLRDISTSNAKGHPDWVPMQTGDASLEGTGEAKAHHQKANDISSPVTEHSAIYRQHQVWNVVVHPVATSSNVLDYTWTRRQPNGDINTTAGKLHRS
jgi:hypothetical protein